MSRRRTLSPEEAELWQAVTRSIRPLHPSPRVAPPAPPVPPASPSAERQAAPAPPAAPVPLAPFRLGEKAAPSAAANGRIAPPAMDVRTHDRMTRGRLEPEARLDLHGMTLAEAHGEMIRFILGAQASGLRLVLVITGKGRGHHDPVPRPFGPLRHQVPQWLRLPPLAPSVLEVSEAHRRHGGAGAFYVYLRRSRGSN